MRSYYKKRRLQSFNLSLKAFFFRIVIAITAPFLLPISAIAEDHVVDGAVVESTVAVEENEEGGRWKYNAEMFASPGDERDLVGFELLFPVWQNASSLAFIDYRGTRSSENTTEHSLGTGYRKFSGDYIYGVNLFYDTRTTSVDNRFNQVTVGFEMLSTDWDYRLNIYTPASDAEYIEDGDSAEQFFGRRIYVNGVSEEVLDGFDIEVGYLMKAFKWESRVFLAAYTFSGSNDEAADGGRLTFEVRPEKNVSFSLSYQNDSLFDSQLRGEFRYSFAYLHVKELRQLRERMLEVARRDVD